jgi:hypothetical protein
MASSKQQPPQQEDTDDDLLSIVFLDMDGVLLPFQQSNNNIPTHTIEALSYIMEQVPSARLVMSSTWRVQEKYIQSVLDALHKYGYEMGSGPLMGIDFYDITDPDMHSERQYEIFEWLQRHQQRPQQHHGDVDEDNDFYRPRGGETNGTQKRRKDVAAWVALDDEELLEGDVNARHCRFFQGHVVKTDSHVGLTMDDAKNAVALLLCQLKQKCGP